DRFDARDRIVEMLQARGRLERKEVHQHNVRHCYRCDTVVEPRLSDQWFVRMAPLAAPALEGVRSGRIRLLPEKWVGVYEHSMSCSSTAPTRCAGRSSREWDSARTSCSIPPTSRSRSPLGATSRPSSGTSDASS